MSAITSSRDSFPLRSLALFLFALNWFIAVLTCIAFFKVREHFPPWFCVPFVVGVTVLSLVVLLYYWQLSQAPQSSAAPGRFTTAAIWLLLLCSVPCSSALHQFYPFRADLLTLVEQCPPGFSFIAVNLVLTAVSLVVVIALAVVYYLRLRRVALIGLLVLAAIMLIPNDDCLNDFNLPWIRMIGASPLMFAANAGVLLIGYCGLQGVLPRLGLVTMTLANAFVLFLGLGHLTRIIW